MMVDIGGAALMFGVPPDSLKEVGQMLLALSATASGKPS
jgi:hypothetical protein